jgi:biopolymer transport protein ExbB
MDFSLTLIWANMGMAAKGVTLVLLVMAVAGLGVFLERIFVLLRTHHRSQRFARACSVPLEAGHFDEVVQVCRHKEHKGSMLAEVVGTGLTTFLEGPATSIPAEEAGLSRLELTRRVLQRKGEAVSAELRRGFPVLASVGSVAPFVGLLGTVVGIINAFESIARTGSGGLGSVSAGIAEALVVTALGLAVAIPAVLCFNFLSTRADRADLALSHAAQELLDQLELRGGALPGARGKATRPEPV